MGRGRRVLVAALKLTRWLERSSARALDYDLPPRLITTSTLLPVKAAGSQKNGCNLEVLKAQVGTPRDSHFLCSGPV